MRKNREFYKATFAKEINWCKENMELIKDDKFLIDMYTILITGSRKMTPKMVEAIHKGMENPMYDPIKKLERMEKIRPILGKITMVEAMVEAKDLNKNDHYKQNYSALPFIKSVKKQLMKNGKLSEKQMQSLNKIYKRYNKGDVDETNKNNSGKKTS
tara:strand:+ start:50 stop:520 length:471 start_codon:yes stop_codon:yes gene_type:complete